MSLFWLLISKILPLYGLIGVGWLAKKKLQVDNQTLAKILIYITAPVIVFNAVFTTRLQLNVAVLPLIFLAIGFSLNSLFYLVGKKVFPDSTKNILAFTAGTGNTGYFGFPVILALLGEPGLNIAVFCVLGSILYENTIGYFSIARANFTWQDSLKKLLHLPALYAFVFGLLLNVIGLHETISPIYTDTVTWFRGCHIIFGMMLIGGGIAAITERQFDSKFISLTFLAKFLIYPLIVLGIIALDSITLQEFTPLIRQVMLVLSLVPLAANTVAYATELKVHPNKAAMAVFLSTLFALVYIPVVVTLLLNRL